jgi:zinc/manganese transport system substrate-binding protein
LVLTVGDLIGVKEGSNPHLWYSPDDVQRVINQIAADYTRIDPSDASISTTRGRSTRLRG